MQGLSGFIPPKAKRVVELGCGQGETGSCFLQLQPECCYIGVDSREEKLQKASGCLSQTARESFSSFDLLRHGITGTVDCFVYHSAFWDEACLREKLGEHMKVLSEDGQMIFVLDNPGYFRNVLALWQGRHALVNNTMVLPELLQLLTHCGLQVDAVLPQFDPADEEMKHLPEVQQMMGAFVQFCKNQQIGVRTELWAKCFILRAARKAQPSLLVQTLIGEAAACARVRIYEPHAFNRTIFGVQTDDREGLIDLSRGQNFDRKVVIRQRMQVRDLKDVMELQKVIQAGYALVYEIDDNPMLWRKDHEKTFFADFVCCHAVQVSTPALAEMIRQFNPNVALFENQLPYLPARRSYREDGPVTIFFGALNRGREWKEIMPLLNAAARKYGDRIRFKVIFDRAFYEALETEHKELVGQEYLKGFVPYAVYEQALHTSDISLLPLLDTPFNRMKSDLKFIESAGHGAVVLASPTVYEQSVRNGRTGFIYHNKKEFQQYLELLIEDKDRRVETAAAAYGYVRQHRLLSQHYEERAKFYHALTSHLPELNKDMAGRFQRIIHQLQMTGADEH